MDPCEESKLWPGMRVSKWWYEQKGMNLAGLRAVADMGGDREEAEREA